MNRIAYMLRDTVNSKVTMSLLTTDAGNTFHILEPPWRNNQQNVSCIPAGEYRCNFMARSSSGKYRNVYHVLDVVGRTGILIHNGNLVRHTLGCLIIGTSRGELGGKPAVLGSRTALRKLVDDLGHDPFTLKIWGDQYV